MKTERSPNQDQRVQAHGLHRAKPIRPEDMGTESAACYSCGTIFVEGGTAEWVQSFGDFFCGRCGVWSQATTDPSTNPMKGQ